MSYRSARIAPYCTELLQPNFAWTFHVLTDEPCHSGVEPYPVLMADETDDEHITRSIGDVETGVFLEVGKDAHSLNAVKENKQVI